MLCSFSAATFLYFFFWNMNILVIPIIHEGDGFYHSQLVVRSFS